MDFSPEFLTNSWGKEFVAGGFGGTAGVIVGYPLDTLRVRQQQGRNGSALHIIRRLVAIDGLSALYRDMTAPLVSVTFQNTIAFQTYAVLSRAVDTNDPPSYTGVAIAGFGTGAIQSLLLTPVKLIKIRMQLRPHTAAHKGPLAVARSIFRAEGLKGIWRRQ